MPLDTLAHASRSELEVVSTARSESDKKSLNLVEKVKSAIGLSSVAREALKSPMPYPRLAATVVMGEKAMPVSTFAAMY